MENKTTHTELGFSPDALAERQAELLALLRQTAPEVISDNQIDIEKLKELIGQERIALEEHYELSWAGKSAARREIQKTTSHTLLPDANNPPQAPHMLIEGENLEVLRVLQKSYYGKVKMIYIDPPYNTGNDSFVYPDDYSETLDEYLKRTGEKNEAGYLNKQSLWKKNSKESGQYHSAWLSMMYPRLYLARNLLHNDEGVIFISIDDNECANLKLICDEIFDENNFLANITWKHTQQSKNDERYFARVYNSLLVYRKTSSVPNFRLPRTKEDNKNYSNPDNDPKGLWRAGDVRSPSYRKTLCFEITTPSGLKILPPENGWRWSEQTLIEKIEEGEIVFSEDEKRIIRKIYLCDQDGRTPENLWDGEASGTTRQANAEIKELFDNVSVFDTPKPTALIKRAAQLLASKEDFIVLDFFAGSGTCSQAIMELNLEDGGNRQCISVQMPELLDETSEAFKAGYRTIADITRARIDKVIAKLKAEHPDKTEDLACAHFTLAPSNFKVWRGDVADEAALRATLDMFQQAEKAEPTADEQASQVAMLTELLLKHGLGALGVHAISKPATMAGVTVHRVLMKNDKQMWLCFEPYTAALKDEIVKAKPAQVVMLNSCFSGDKADELLSNLQLELAGLDIGLTVI